MKSFHTHGNVASLYSKLTNHQVVCAEVQNPRICRPTHDTELVLLHVFVYQQMLQKGSENSRHSCAWRLNDLIKCCENYLNRWCSSAVMLRPSRCKLARHEFLPRNRIAVEPVTQLPISCSQLWMWESHSGHVLRIIFRTLLRSKHKQVQLSSGTRPNTSRIPEHLQEKALLKQRPCSYGALSKLLAYSQYLTISSPALANIAGMSRRHSRGELAGQICLLQFLSQSFSNEHLRRGEQQG